MPHGPLPKEEHLRTGHGKPEFQQVELADEEYIGAPPLPGREDYLGMTQLWYDTWASAPQAAQFLPTDWQRLHMLAPLVDQYYNDLRDPKPAVRRAAKTILAEIRLNETKLGATAYDRLSLRWKMRATEREQERQEREAESGTKPTPTRRSRNLGDPRLALVKEKAS